MQLISLHLFSPEIATHYINALRGEESPEWSWWQDDLKEFASREVTEDEANRLTTGMALAMSEQLPSYYYEFCSLTHWEAMVDRGIGMLMRPPARVFVDHGHNPYLIDKMPIRLEMQGGFPMGGAWVPPHLVPKLQELIEQRFDIWAKRLHEAEMDPYPILTTIHMAAEEAGKQGLGIMESMDVLQPGAQVVATPDRKKMDPAMRERIDLALKEEKQSLMDKLFRRGQQHE